MPDLKVWNGSAFVTGTPKIWNGSAFVSPSSAWIWDGSAFQKVWPSAIEFVSAYGISDTSISSVPMPTHAEGDTILLWTFYNNNSNAPSLAAGFTSLATVTGASNQRGCRLAMRVAESDSETITGLSRTSSAIVLVYRNVAAVGTPVINHPTNSANSVAYPAAALANTDGTSWGLRFLCSTDPVSGAPSANPNTLRATAVVASTGDSHAAGWDSNGPISSGIASATQPGGGYYNAVSVELKQHL